MPGAERPHLGGRSGWRNASWLSTLPPMRRTEQLLLRGRGEVG